MHHPLAAAAVEEPRRLVLVQGEVVEAAAEQHPLEEEVGEAPRCLVVVLVAAEAELYLLAEAEVEAVQGLLVVVVGAEPCLPAEAEVAAGHLQ